MLPKEYRLPKYLVPKIFLRGDKLSTKFGVFIFIKSEVKNSRFLFIVGKKSTKKATERNRIKRLLRVSLQTISPNLHNNIDAIFLSKSFSQSIQSIHVLDEFQRILK